MGRASTSSDGSSTLSDATTACSISKSDDAASAKQGERHGHKKRGLRQKARDVMHDLGQPPTRRQDEKDGLETRNYNVVDARMLCMGMMRQAKV